MSDSWRERVSDEGSYPFLIFNTVLGAIAWIATYTGTAIEPAVILTVLMVFDFVAGICAAWRRHEEVTSHKMKVGMVGKMLLLMLPLTVALMAKGTSVDLTNVVTFFVYVLVLSEGYSVISNIHCYFKGEKLPEIDAVAILAGKIKTIVKEVLLPK